MPQSATLHSSNTHTDHVIKSFLIKAVLLGALSSTAKPVLLGFKALLGVAKIFSVNNFDYKEEKNNVLVGLACLSCIHLQQHRRKIKFLGFPSFRGKGPRQRKVARACESHNIRR